MNNLINLTKIRSFPPFCVLALWSLILLANFIPTIPQPSVIIGYLWKVEFALAAFLLAAIAFLLKLPAEKFVRFSRKEFFFVILPLVLFTAWSGFSVFWAESSRNALHHTLLWACYCIFYLLVRQLVNEPKLLAVSFKITGLVVFVLGAACIVEYASSPEQINSFFTYRYYKYAEALVTLLPVFLVLSLRSKSKMSLLYGFVAVIAAIGVLLSLSRTLLVSGFISVGLFFALVFIFQNWKKHFKKSALIIGLFLICAVLSQIHYSPGQEKAAAKLFNTTENSQSSSGSRVLFWAVALEEFKSVPLAGVGADNYSTVYGTARESFSAKNPENKLLEINEDVLAERAHNEYLQILSELGIVGACLFAWLLGGAAYLFLSLRRKRVTFLSIAAIAGISAFLISSLASSYSFRVPANGLCFFFLLALAAKSSRFKVQSSKFSFSLNLKPALSAFGTIICAAMLVFSSVRGVSLMYLQFALSSTEETQAGRYYQKAIALDSQEGLFRYYYGLELYNRTRAVEAVPQMRMAIKKGFATSISYFHLASAQIVSKQTFDAEQTFAEGLQIYPRSIFLRTAFASFLMENGKISQSQTQYEKALAINAEQARSWRLAHIEGMKKLSQIEAQDKNFVKAMDLKPVEGVYALLDFQRQFNPNLVRR